MVMGGGIFLSGIFNPAMAAPPNCDDGEVSKRCKNTGGEDSSGNLVAKFCLHIANPSGPGLDGDGSISDGGFYCDRNKKDKVMVFTGKGPGFRFDTNKGKSAAARNVQINFEGGSITVEDTTYTSGLYEIDFRFDLDSGGLDLGDIDVGLPNPAMVSVGIRIQTLDGNELGLLGYGDAPDLFSDPSLDTTCMIKDDDHTAKVLVTRTADDAWTIESDPSNSKACLWVGHSRFTGQDGILIEMPFEFTITIDP